MSRSQANLLLLVVALIWGSAFVAQAQGMEGVRSLTFNGLRFLLGACIVAPFAWFDYRRARTRLDAMPLRDIVQVGGLGLLLMFGAVFQQIGIERGASVTHAGFLTALYVPQVPILGWMLMKERPHWSVWPTSLGCVLGTWMLSGAQSMEMSGGDVWVIASSLFWALHVVWVGRIADRLAAPFLVAWGQFVVCGVVSLAWACVGEPISLDGIRQAAGPILYTGILSVGVAYTGQVVGQRYAESSTAAIILSAETLFAALFGYLLMGDRLDGAGILGGALIFASIIAVQVLPVSSRLWASAKAE